MSNHSSNTINNLTHNNQIYFSHVQHQPHGESRPTLEHKLTQPEPKTQPKPKTQPNKPNIEKPSAKPKSNEENQPNHVKNY